MAVLRRLARKVIWLPPHAIAGLRPGINEAAASTRLPAPEPRSWVTHPLDLDIGEVADGYP